MRRPISLKKTQDYDLALLWLMGRIGPQKTENAVKEFQRQFSRLIPKAHFQPNKDGTPRWDKNVRWARQHLVKQGLMDGSERGVWKLTEAGQKQVRRRGVGGAPADAQSALPAPDQTKASRSVETRLSLDSGLKKYLTVDLSRLEPGLRLYRESAAVKRLLVAAGTSRIDILAVDAAGSLVIIELVAEAANEDVCAQVLRDMGWVKATLAGKRAVRGIVVSSGFDERTRLTAELMPNVALVEYRLSFTFDAVSKGR